MGLLGNGFEDPRSSAVMALAGGLLKGDFGGGLLGANQAYAQTQADALKKQLVDMQLKNYESEIAARGLAAKKDERNQGIIASILGGAKAAPGQLGSGSFGIVPPPQGRQAIPEASGLMQNLTPDSLAALKIAGLDLTDVYKLANVPTSISAGSYAFLPGQQPKYMNDPTKGMAFDGGRVTGIPGFAETNASIKGAETAAVEAAKANQDLVTVTDNDGIPRLVTRASVTTPQQPQRQPSMQVTPEQQRGADAERIRMLQNELNNPALPAADRAAITRELQRTVTAQVTPGFPQSMGVQAGLSPQQAAQAKALETAATQKEMTAARQAEARDKDVKTAKQFLQIANQADLLLKEGPTASGIGSAVDAAAAVFGKSTRGAELAQQLKAIGGWLVANVPRMEGPQSNFDVGNYQTMAADVANDRLPAERRLAALQSIKDMMNSTITGKPIERGIGKVQPYTDPDKERRYQEWKSRSGQ